MTFLIAWYGDLPEKALWYLERSPTGWIAVLLIMFVIGAILPFAVLLRRAARRSRPGLRIAGGLILLGSTLHFFWLLVPSFDRQAGPIVVACVALCVLTVVALIIGTDLRSALRPWEASHAG